MPSRTLSNCKLSLTVKRTAGKATFISRRFGGSIYAASPLLMARCTDACMDIEFRANKVCIAKWFPRHIPCPQETSMFQQWESRHHQRYASQRELRFKVQDLFMVISVCHVACAHHLPRKTRSHDITWPYSAKVINFSFYI